MVVNKLWVLLLGLENEKLERLDKIETILQRGMGRKFLDSKGAFYNRNESDKDDDEWK